jgi:Tol biopolymer transport system component
MRRTAAVLVVLVAALGVAAPAASAAFPGSNGAIVYGWSSLDEPETGPPYRYENAVRTVAPAGGAPRTVRGCVRSESAPIAGDCTMSYADPAFSRDGRLIAFDAGVSLALIGVDGDGLRLLGARSADDGEPAFSPDGRRLAFSAGTSAARPDGGVRGVWVDDLDGGEARRLSLRGRDPAWSTRNMIAFLRSGEIWLVRPNGTGLRRLTGGGGFAPAWSPHGTKLAFSRHGSIFVFDFVTKRLRRAVRGAGAMDLAWSPDGRRFAVHVFDGGVWTMRTDGGHVRQIVDGGAGATYAFDANGVDWQPLR